jgi:hypothetical protein
MTATITTIAPYNDIKMATAATTDSRHVRVSSLWYVFIYLFNLLTITIIDSYGY